MDEFETTLSLWHFSVANKNSHVKCYLRFRFGETCGEFIILKDAFKSIYGLSLKRREDPWWSSHCPFMLEKHLFPSLSRDICFVTSWQWRQLLWKTHNGAGIVNADTAHPLTIMYFHQKDCNIEETIQTDMEREGKACKACSLEFQSTRKALRVINKMAEKNRFIV